MPHFSTIGSRRVAITLSSVLCAVLLSSCSLSTASASKSDFESGVADTLEKKVGIRPTVYCGETDITLADERVVHCDVSDPAEPGTVFDATVTISNIRSDGYSVDVQVADTPK